MYSKSSVSSCLSAVLHRHPSLKVSIFRTQTTEGCANEMGREVSPPGIVSFSISRKLLCGEKQRQEMFGATVGGDYDFFVLYPGYLESFLALLPSGHDSPHTSLETSVCHI
jgi:hypothetical protein